MEKAPPEKSSSFARKECEDQDESDPLGAAPPSDSPAAKPKAEDDGASTVLEKGEQEKEEANEAEESVEANPLEDAAEEEEEEDALHSFDKVLEDIDSFLSFLAVDAGENATLEGHELSVQRFLDLLQAKALNYIANSHEGKSTWGQCPEEDSSFLQAVARVSKLKTSLDVSKWGEASGEFINRIWGIHQQAMALLEDEFRSLLEDCKPINSDNNDCESKTSEQEGQANDDQTEDANNSLRFPQDVVSNLNQIAKEMISGGYETECCQVYILMRRNVIDELLSKTGFEGISIDDVQKMPWESLQREIAKWVDAFKQSAGLYFPSELKLIESVFTGNSDTSTYLFHNLIQGFMIQMLNFAEAVAISKRSPEKLFKFLDMYEALRDMDPILNGLFGEYSGHEFVKSELFTARSRLGESSVSIFCDLENSIRSDTGKNVVPGGAIHPLTRYIMNYLELTCEYKETLEQVFRDHLKIERADSNNRSEFQGDSSTQYVDPNENQSQFSIQIGKIMFLLDSNLEAKSKLYKDTSLGSIFMMNNGRYILQKVKGSPQINELMGDNWRRKKSSDLRQCHKTYQRETWNKVLGCLRDNHGLTVNGKVVKPELKERFKNFNAMFDEIHKTQSSWVVCDEQLQSELRVSISAVVIPAYRSFLGRFAQSLTPGRQTEKYIKYQPEDLETYIDDLFDGKKKP